MLFVVGLMIFVSVLAIPTLAPLLVFFADELFSREIKDIVYIINGRQKRDRKTQTGDRKSEKRQRRMEIEKDICCNNWEKTYSDLKKIDDDMAVAKVTFRWSPKT